MAKLREALQRGRRTRILVIGDLMLDEYVWGSVKRVSQVELIPVVEGSSTSELIHRITQKHRDE